MIQKSLKHKREVDGEHALTETLTFSVSDDDTNVIFTEEVVFTSEHFTNLINVKGTENRKLFYVDWARSKFPCVNETE